LNGPVLFSKCFSIDYDEVIELTEKTLDDFDAFLNRIDELRHAYDKFNVDELSDKPPFGEAYASVNQYVKDVLPEGSVGE